MSVFDIKEEAFEVIIDGKKYVGHLAYQELSPRPLVLIFPNVAGLKGFDQQKAYEMAELGYVGLAVDLYGDHTIPFKDREDALGSALPQIFGFMNELLWLALGSDSIVNAPVAVVPYICAWVDALLAKNIF